MIKRKTEIIVRNIWRWLMIKRLTILFIMLGYIGTQIFNDGEFFGVTLILGIPLLLIKED